MQHCRRSAGKLIGTNAVAAEAQHLAPHALRLIDAADLVVRRVFEREHPLAPQKLHDESVEVLRTRADDDLPRLHADAARTGQIRRDGAAQAGAAVVRRFDKNALAIFAKHAPHRFGKRRERKFIFRAVQGKRAAIILHLRDGKAIRCRKAHKKAAALAGLKVSLVAQNSQRMLHRDNAHAGFTCDEALAGKLCPQRVHAAHNVAPQLMIKLQIRALRGGLINVIMHGYDLFSCSGASAARCTRLT